MDRQEFIKKGEYYINNNDRFDSCNIRLEQFLYDFKTYGEDYKHYAIYNNPSHNLFLDDITSVLSKYCLISLLYFNIFNSFSGYKNTTIAKEYIEKLNEYYND